MANRNKILYIFLILCLSFASMALKGKEKNNNYRIIKKEQVVAIENYKNVVPQIEVTEEDNLLSEFKTFDIGNTINKGNVTKEDSIIEILAIGSGFSDIKDEGFFLFKQLKGNFEINVRIHSLSLVDLYTKAGIMLRSDLSDNSKHVSFFVYPDTEERNGNNSGYEFQYRPKRGSESKMIYPGEQMARNYNLNFPDIWIKLKRDGNFFTSYVSYDKINWHPYTTYRQKMPKSLLVGLAVTSNSLNGFARAEFSDLQVDSSK